MKKVALRLVLGATVVVCSAWIQQQSLRECKYGECSRIKANGYQSGNCAQKDSNYCYTHNR